MSSTYLTAADRSWTTVSHTPGGIFSEDDVVVTINGSATFSKNVAGSLGGGAGAILRPNGFSIVGALFNSNRATIGGALWVTSNTKQSNTFSGLTFQGNVALGDGGGLYTNAGAGQDRLHNSSFFQNRAGMDARGIPL